MVPNLLNEIDVLRDVCQKLEFAGLPYMITGSMAMNYYAQPRMTRDIDLIVEIRPGDASRIEEMFSSEYYVSREAVETAARQERMFNMIHNQSVIKVDFIVRKSADYRRLEFSRRTRVSIANFEAFIVSKEDLILSKLIWAKDSHSEMQLRDVKNLLMSGADRDYIRGWADKLGVSDLLEESFS